MTDVIPWAPNAVQTISDRVSDPAKIAASALQLRERERTQISANFQAENYEMVASFVWLRAMALLKKQIGALGMEFIGELLQRPDIDEFSDVRTEVSDAEAISLARDLGMITALQTMRLLQAQETIGHFTSLENGPMMDQDEAMTREEAVSCLRVCVQGILGHEDVIVADDFKKFREKLGSESFTAQSAEIRSLASSPYFFLRTAISILLSFFRTAKGAQLEHASRNAYLIIPKFWEQLKEPEKWQIGQAYASEFTEGNKEAVKGLHAVLLVVKGFDFVPENLRSSTFVQVASKVIAAHQGMNNYYNEPGPMKELASLGTSIPGPALATCTTAVLCVKLGNFYGTSQAAQLPADQVIKKLSEDRWVYYLNGKLDTDRIILSKLTQNKPRANWINLISKISIDLTKITSKNTRLLIRASQTKDSAKVGNIAQRMLEASLS